MLMCFVSGGGVLLLLYKLEAQEAFAFLDIFFNITEILQQHLCGALLKFITFKQGKKKTTQCQQVLTLCFHSPSNI